MADSKVTPSWIAYEVFLACARALDEHHWEHHLVDSVDENKQRLFSVDFKVPEGFPYSPEDDEEVYAKWRDRYLVPTGRALAIQMRDAGLHDVAVMPAPLGGVTITRIVSKERGLALQLQCEERGEYQVTILAA